MPPFLHSIKKLYPLSGHLNFSNTTIFLSSTDFISIAFWQDYFFALLITIINQDKSIRLIANFLIVPIE